MSTLTPMDVASRIPRLRDGLAEAGCDAMLVTRMVNIRYLTGFSGSSATLLVRPADLIFVTDGRYGTQASEQLGRAGVEATVEVVRTQAEQKQLLSDHLAVAGAGTGAGGTARLGLEAEAVSWAQHRRYAEWFEGVELVPTENLVEALRLVKDAGEVARMAEAARIADEALAVVRPMLAEGMTERQIALMLDFEMARKGASGPSFDTIVASGPNGAMPHHRPTDRPIGRGELVVIDYGAVFDGYCSDTTRTFCVREPATATAGRMVEVVAASQAAGVEAVRSGVEARVVDDVCRRAISEAEPEWADAFLHSTGHGVGLDIHEDPRVSTTSKDTLRAGMVITVEPGVYLPEIGGVRIEDTVVVTESGCQVLTNAPKELIVA